MNRLLPFLLLPACYQGPSGIAITHDPCQPVVVVPATDATDAERAGIVAALKLWNDAAGARLTLDEIDGAPRVPISFRDAAPVFFGIYEDNVGDILINRDLDEDPAACAVTIAHELGHSFGLVHVSDKTSVMVAGNVTVPPGAVDVAALAALWGSCR